MRFAEILELEPAGEDTWLGHGPDYPWGGVYGGQIACQALRAASASVGEGFAVHSLHAYFIRPGDTKQPIRYRVDRVREGRSFCTRRVAAVQSEKTILELYSSFMLSEEGPDVEPEPMREVPAPETLPNTAWAPYFQRRLIPGSAPSAEDGKPTIGSAAWFKLEESLGDDPVLQACALTFLSDDLPTEAVAMRHPARPRTLDGFWWASLDHSVWFHRPVRNDQWCLHDFNAQSLVGARGLANGRIYSADGVHVATVAQEIVYRARRDRQGGA